MKDFFNILKTVFAVLGCFIGAGFITGAELVVFFGNNFVLWLGLSSVLFFIFLTWIFMKSKKIGGYKNLIGETGKGNGIFSVSVIISSFFTLTVTLSSLDDLFFMASGVDFPTVSILTLCFSAITLRRGISAICKINLFLMPLVLIITDFALSVNGKMPELFIVKSGFSFLPFLYVFMNIFNSLPVISDCAVNKNRKVLVISALIIAVIMFVQGLIILSAVKYAGTQNTDAPLIFAVDSRLNVVVSVCAFFAVFTSALCACYPLKQSLGEFFGGFLLIIISVASVLLSRLKINVLIEKTYTLVGIFGFLFFCFLTVYELKSRYKKLKYTDNNFINSGEVIMKKSKKSKIKKLSDEDYAKYIMSLKDEKPPLAVRKLQEK